MKVLAAVCGVMIVLLGFWSTGRNPTDVQAVVELVCLIGGLILCFLAVVLARLDAVAERLDTFDPAPAEAVRLEKTDAAPKRAVR